MFLLPLSPFPYNPHRLPYIATRIYTRTPGVWPIEKLGAEIVLHYPPPLVYGRHNIIIVTIDLTRRILSIRPHAGPSPETEGRSPIPPRRVFVTRLTCFGLYDDSE